MASRTCAVCKAAVSADDRRCPYCGADDPTHRRRIGIAFFLLIGIVPVAAAWWLKRPDPIHLRELALDTLPADAAVPRARYWPTLDPPVADPDQQASTARFSLAIARALPPHFTLKDLQSAAGSAGKIVFRNTSAGDPYVTYRWITPGGGQMLASVRPSGFIEARLTTLEGLVVTANTEGELYCDPGNCGRHRR